MAKDKTEKDLEMELLEQKIKTLEAHVGKKGKSADELYQERLMKYEASKKEREEQKQKIEARKMEIWQEFPKFNGQEIALIEAWERRAAQLENVDPVASKRYREIIKEKYKEVAKDPNR